MELHGVNWQTNKQKKHLKNLVILLSWPRVGQVWSPLQFVRLLLIMIVLYTSIMIDYDCWDNLGWGGVAIDYNCNFITIGLFLIFFDQKLIFFLLKLLHD